MRKGLSEIGGPFFVVCKKRAAHDERLIVVISKAVSCQRNRQSVFATIPSRGSRPVPSSLSTQECSSL